MEKGRFVRTNPFKFNYAFDNYGSTDYDTNGFEEPEETLNWVSSKTTVFTSIIESTNGFTQTKDLENRERSIFEKFNF